MKSRISALGVFALIGVLALTPSLVQGQMPAPTGQRLRDLAGSFPIGFAAESNFWNLPDAAQYQQTAASEFSMLTPGNQLKWDTTEPQQNNFNFAPGDMNGLFAQQHNMVFHGHTLVWHNQLPGWLTGGSWTAASLTAVLQNHVDKVVAHFKGKIAFWDVVNEAFNDDGTRRASMFQNIIGQSYIEIAFQHARAADPAAILVYNDFNIETINPKSDAVFAMVQDFQRRGIPIDGIGLQTHLTAGGLDYNSLAANMQRFANLGLKIYISELDVRETVPASMPALQSQATVYQNVLDRCLLQPACKGFTIWGFTDKYSWIPGTFPGFGAALPFDQNYVAKPAYFALQTRLAALNPGTPTVSISAPANNATFVAPANITINAIATVSTGTITRVDFLRNGVVVGSDTASPFSFSMTNVPAGTYSLTAQAVSSGGATATSAPVTAVVGTTAAACKITYTVVNQWNTGFQADVKITNLGPAISGWTLAWTFLNGQTITQLWNGPFTQTGASVVTHDAGWNANLAPGGTADVGFTANWSGTNAAPTAFTLNGAACNVGP